MTSFKGCLGQYRSAAITLLVFALFAAVVAGCSSASADDDVAILEPGSAPKQVDIPALGKLDFSVDASKTAFAEFTPGDDLQIELAEGSGSTWKLTIPGDALDEPQTIKMTELSSIKSSDIGGAFPTGVLLEPDGLTFSMPATLTVSAPVGATAAVIMTGAQDGSDVQVAMPAGATPGSSATVMTSASIFHFSSGSLNTYSDPAVFDRLIAQVAAQNKKMVEEARSLLKKRIEVEDPPSMPLGCNGQTPGEADNRQIQEYVDKASAPELDLVRRLLAVRKNEQLLGMDEPTWDLEVKLTQRLQKKVLALMGDAKGRPEKILPVNAFAGQVSKMIELIGASEVPEMQAFLSQVGEWLASSIKPMLDDLVNNHNYEMVQPLLDVAREAGKYGMTSAGANAAQGKILDSIEAAMRFDLEMAFDVVYGTGTERLVESKFPTTWMFPAKYKNLIRGEGTGKYTKYYNPSVPTETVKAGSFPVTASIQNFDACTGIVTLKVDRFYPDSEITVYKDNSVPIPFVRDAWTLHFADHLDRGWYSFDFKLNNGREYAVDDKATFGVNELHAEFRVKLIHRPGKPGG